MTLIELCPLLLAVGVCVLLGRHFAKTFGWWAMIPAACLGFVVAVVLLAGLFTSYRDLFREWRLQARRKKP